MTPKANHASVFHDFLRDEVDLTGAIGDVALAKIRGFLAATSAGQ